ncbi:TRAP transporter substrate-binding protein [Rhodoplanes sp. TEM]|uniref:TRAP transporter substrate-binding protein n=1 Tax=Rhodoplanes tepidamans TaxID=200616 RepID=A0ABT5JBC4_RHOTP|nr:MULTISPECIES: TRAP transporter substrate-binding protein [Rhodoplanes]MDC7786738.1 TRAP transporter substrate-binding protein [Rhodoplanes tepidamans]MDC7983744.1 TRAP transporter substrate-binding protein [Rhodoplanes sp. TEM]
MPVRPLRRTVPAFAAALAVWVAPALWAAPAAAQEKPILLKISLWVPPAHPLVQSARDWAASMEKASGGTIKSVVFPAEQLGKAFDHYDMVRDGIADVGYVSPGYQPGRFPIINAAQLPFTVTNAKGGSVAVDAWYRKYAGKEMADTHFCLAFVHDPGTLHSKKKITQPGDLKGVKVRPAQVIMGELVTTLGGTNVQASAPESRDALERGVADAITFPWNSMFLFGIDKVTKYSLDVPLYTTAYAWTMNKAVYDNASPAQKAVIDQHCTSEWAARLSGPWTDYEHAGREKMKAASGREVVKLDEAQIAAWKAAVQPLRDTWAESVRKVGGDPAAIAAELKAQLEAQQAAF